MFKQEQYPEMIEEGQTVVFDATLPYIMDSVEITDTINEMFPTLENTMVDGSGLLQEETMDVSTKFQVLPFQPVWPRGPPERTPFPGELNFCMEISASDVHRKKYLYSHQLNRIYVDIREPFPVSFRWDAHRAPAPLFVRATVVFADESQAEKRVERCTQHTHENNADKDLTIVKNVLHSSREKNTHGVYYCGHPDQPDSWFSVLVEFPTGPGTHAYLFGCKNSCPNGINRRAIDIIFALEDCTGHVYGRQIVGARACACPKRDMHKDLETAGVYRAGKRRVQANVVDTKAKKVKVEDPETDDEVVRFPQLDIIGTRALVAGLEVSLRMMEQAASFRRADPQASERYNRAITELKAHLDSLKQPKSRW